MSSSRTEGSGCVSRRNREPAIPQARDPKRRISQRQRLGRIALNLASRSTFRAARLLRIASFFFSRYSSVSYPKLRIREIAPRRNVAQCCGTREALTAGRGKRESRRDAAAGRGRIKTDDAQTLQTGSTLKRLRIPRKLRRLIPDIIVHHRKIEQNLL